MKKQRDYAVVAYPELVVVVADQPLKISLGIFSC